MKKQILLLTLVSSLLLAGCSGTPEVKPIDDDEIIDIGGDDDDGGDQGHEETPAVMVSIKIKTMPSKTVYEVGEELDLTGLVLTAVYSDGAIKDVTEYTFSGFDSSKPGTTRVTIKCGDFTTTLGLTIRQPVLTGISITTMPTKEAYEIGEQLDLTGLVITGEYSDGSSKEVDDYIISGFDSSESGTTIVTIKYGSFTTTFALVINSADPDEEPVVVMTSIKVTTMPTKVAYEIGEQLDLTGLVVTASYSDGASETVTDYEISGFDSSTPGSNTVTVSYGGLTTSFGLTINETILKSIEVTTMPNKTEYQVGEEIDLTGLVVTEHYSNGDDVEIKDISKFNVSGFDSSKPATIAVTLSYRGFTTTFNLVIVSKTRINLKIQFHVDAKSSEGIAYKKRVDAFNVQYGSQYRVTAIFKARTQGGADYEQQLIAQKLEGTLPDVITFDAPNCASYAYSNILYNLTNSFTTEEKDDFLSLNTVLQSTGPQLFGLPVQESSAGFFYNKKMFNDLGVDVSNYTVQNPWTFEQFENVCSRLLNAGKVPVDMRFDATKDETATYLLYPFIYAAGGEFVSENGWNATNYYNKTETKNGFKFLKGLITKGYSSYAIGATDFFTGKVGMYLSSGWTIPDLDNKYPEQFPNRDTWGLLPYPQNVSTASATGSWSYGVTLNDNDKNAPKNKAGAVALLRWMSSTESTTEITNATGMIPSRKSCNPNYAAGSPERVLLDQLSLTGRERPVTAGYPIFTSTFSDIIAGLRDKDVDTSVDAATAELQAALDEIRGNL